MEGMESMENVEGSLERLLHILPFLPRDSTIQKIHALLLAPLAREYKEFKCKGLECNKYIGSWSS
jgi:hypothetical protein